MSRIRGNPKLLADLGPSDLTAYVNLNGEEGLGKKPVKKAVNLDFHERVSLVSIAPDTISVSAKKRDESK